jgi:hypothetical protein
MKTVLLIGCCIGFAAAFTIIVAVAYLLVKRWIDNAD